MSSWLVAAIAASHRLAARLRQEVEQLVEVPGDVLQLELRHHQRCQSVVQLIHDPQRLATRRKHVKAREPSDQLLDELGHRRDDVLAIVEHEQQITVRQPSGERIHVGLTARTLQPHLRCHLTRDQVRRP